MFLINLSDFCRNFAFYRKALASNPSERVSIQCQELDGATFWLVPTIKDLDVIVEPTITATEIKNKSIVLPAIKEIHEDPEIAVEIKTTNKPSMFVVHPEALENLGDIQ